MSLKKFATGALAAAVLVTAPAFANEHNKTEDGTVQGYDKQKREYSNHTRYEWTTEPGQVILFKDPVSFEGEVTALSSSHRTIKADNGMTIQVPNMALVWNGDTSMFAQNAEIGERVVLHLREEEPYRVMQKVGDNLAVGSYDGVFFLPEAFVADINLNNLDGDIYRNDTADVDLDNNGTIEDNERNLRQYDNDLESAEDKD